MANRDANGEPANARSRLGLVLYCCRFRRQFQQQQPDASDLFEPLTFLKHCHQLQAGGMQASLGVLHRDALLALRRFAENEQLFVEAIIRPPFEAAELDRFDAEMRTAKEAGAAAVRTVIMPGRRYEYFDSLTKYREYATRGKQALERAAPIAEKRRLPLAVENHKDHRNDERVALFEAISNEYVGACLDTGNSFALLEDPIETVKLLAPWTHSVHLKDQAVALYQEGFLLGDITLGKGCFDLSQMVSIVRKQRPHVRFSLELITRDPLRVPVWSEGYWATFPDLPGSDLARIIGIVKSNENHNLPRVSELAPASQLALEDANVADSLKYAREHLGL
jgi:sugar phosphate isomerase/epimerase